MATILPKIYYSFGLGRLLSIPDKRELDFEALCLESSSGVVLSDKYDRGAYRYFVTCHSRKNFENSEYALVRCDESNGQKEIILGASDLKAICREYAQGRVAQMWSKGTLPSGLKHLEDIDELQEEIYYDAMWSLLEARDEETLDEFLSNGDSKKTKPVRKFEKTKLETILKK